MSTATADFEQLQADLQEGGIAALLERLADQLLERRMYRELFEARKMQVRHRLGLPPLYGIGDDELEPKQLEQLEDGLIEACREVGLLLLEDGQIREGWMYMRPVGDKQAVADVLADLDVDDDNLDDVIEVALTEGVSPKLGYQLVLDHYGTCNAITAFESQVIYHGPAAQKEAAGLLVPHLHAELLAAVKADISRHKGIEPPENSLRELLADRDWLFADNNYHTDTTHLASTVRYSRVLQDEEELRLALDLTEYGRRLGSQFQFQESEPFADLYPSHALYLQALLGERVDDAIDYFRKKAEALDVQEHGTIAIEVYVDLLARLGRDREAVAATIQMMPEGGRFGVAPSLLELSQRAGDFQPYIEHCHAHDQLLGYATGLVLQEWSNEIMK